MCRTIKEKNRNKNQRKKKVNEYFQLSLINFQKLILKSKNNFLSAGFIIIAMYLHNKLIDPIGKVKKILKFLPILIIVFKMR